ncbi:ATP-binding protein [Schlesneria paludicola]|uniref:ATP-binding protein n=1 Tax=Schlesneria paludicola TaxID=360056 RepID=UPI0002EF0700|nr:ATP-binding protein [Schlesneria paludicola]
MKTSGFSVHPTRNRQDRCDEILQQYQDAIRTRADRFFTALLILEYLLGITAMIGKACWSESVEFHGRCFAATIIGAFFLSPPLYSAWYWPARPLTRHTIAITQMLFAAFLFHASTGQIGIPLQILVSLTLLTFYRDWHILVTATAIAAAIYAPTSLLMIDSNNDWLLTEQISWVIFADLFLIWSCHQARQEWKNMAQQQALLESTNDVIEAEVQSRTEELAASERELTRSQNAIRAILDTAPDGILTMNGTGRIESVNNAVERLFGYHKDELIGQHVSLIVEHSSVKDSESCDGPGPSHGIPHFASFDRQVVGCRRGGTTFPIDVTISEVHADGVTRFTGMIRDITLHKLAETNLAEQARLAEFAAKIGQVLVSAGGLTTILRSCTDAIVSHLEIALAEIWTMSDTAQSLELAAQTDKFTTSAPDHHRTDTIRVEIEAVARQRANYHSDDVTADPRIENAAWIKRERITEFAGYPLVVENRVVGVIAIYSRSPLTSGAFRKLGQVANCIALAIQRANGEIRLKQAMTAAAQASDAKSQFLANMSHELRTPMNAIIGYSEMLVEEYQDLGQTEFLPDIMKIRSAGTHLLQLINDILDMSKIESGKMDVTAEAFEVVPFLHEVSETLRPTIEQNGNRFILESNCCGATIVSDSTKIRQILFNLLSNAAKFTKEGIVTLNTNFTESDDRRHLVLEVGDSGIGMTEEQLSRICEPFMQAESTTTRRFGGTGLGLAITKRFCNMLGGELSIRSVPGRGSTFTVCIPAHFVSTKGESHSFGSGINSNVDSDTADEFLTDDHRPIEPPLARKTLASVC